ncbi:MAG: zinc-binding alcohol dehydrogenase family protein [Dehalococcoidia bacterium]|nr:zinc-binding alcohol dehydrogenase family protein [Dehalococcoidia bacterium]
MKAAVYYENGGPEVLRYEDVPDPELRPGGILIDVRAIGIQGGDTLHRSRAPLTAVPHIVGYQCAGVVKALGDGVTEFQVGQPVVATMGNGSHASVVSVAARAAYAIPEGLSIEQAAAIPIEFGTAADCLFEFGGLQAGQSVLIHAGASGVGLAGIQLAKRAGATVLATASSDDRLARLAEYGCDHAINYVRDNWVEKAKAITGRGPDLIVDSVGGPVLQQSLEAVAYRGRVISVGRAGRDDSRQDTWPLVAKNASLVGVLLGVEMAVNAARTKPMIERLLADAAKGELRMAIDTTFPLAEAAAAHAFIESRQAFGRVLLIP